jgi:hypothetical protein
VWNNEKNFAYLSEPSAIKGVAYEKVMIFTATEVDVPFEIRLVDYATEDVVVNLNVDNEALIADYNTVNNTSYKAVPQDKILVSGEGVSIISETAVTVTIPAGSNRAEVNINVKRFDGMEVGDEYAVTAKITKVENFGSFPAPGSWATLLVPVTLLAEFLDGNDLPGTPIPVSSFPKFKYTRDDKNFTLQASGWGAMFENFTVELWINASAFGAGSQGVLNGGNAQLFDNRKQNGVFSLPDEDEIFVRFGNAMGTGGSGSLEIKAFRGSGSDLAPTWKVNEWIHVAIVYKKRDNALIIYRNGEQFQKIDGYPEPINNNGRAKWQHLGMLGTHSGGIGEAHTMAVRELRFWKTARRAMQIKNFMRLRVDPSEPDLVAFWTFEDESKKGTTPTSFTSTATWGGGGGIPKPPIMNVRTPATYFGSWGDPVDFSTVKVTLKDGSKSPAN